MNKITTTIDNRKNRIMRELATKGYSKEKRRLFIKELKRLKLEEIEG